MELDTFYQIKLNKKNSQIFYFENDSLKFEQNFNFGSNLILEDIAKVTFLNINLVKKIIKKIPLNQTVSGDELIEKDLFENEDYRKIKKKLIIDIAAARIEELLEKFLTKNINTSNFNKKRSVVFLEIYDHSHLKCFKDIYRNLFLKNSNVKFEFSEKIEEGDLIGNVNKIAHFGWKKEAIPVTFYNKSLIARFFEAIFS